MYITLLEDNISYTDKYTILSNILDLYLYMGKFNELETMYLRNVKEFYNEKEKALFMVTYAYWKFLAGDIQKSKEIFKQCEQILINFREYGLHNFAGYMYKIFLLYQKEYNELDENLKLSIEISKILKNPLDKGLNYLILAKYKRIKNANKKDVLKILEKSIDYLRKSNELKFICEGLISKAEILSSFGDFNEANESLLEANDILLKSDTKLLLANWYIVAIKLALAEKNLEKSNTYYLESKTLSNELDKYFIFKEELKKLELNFTKDI